MSNEYLDWIRDLHDEPLHSEDHNHWLILKCPWLSYPNQLGYKTIKLDEMPEGWYKAFGEQMCLEIEKALREVSDKDYDDGWAYEVFQIKEKYGELRWYDSGAPEPADSKITEIIEKYQNLSRHTCIECGAPAEWRSLGPGKGRSSGFIPLCDKCKKKHKETYTLINGEKS